MGQFGKSNATADGRSFRATLARRVDRNPRHARPAIRVSIELAMTHSPAGRLTCSELRVLDWIGKDIAMATLSIGELARAGRVHLETIRFYEREGLMLAPRRKQSGHRAYAPGDVRRLRFIQRAKALGFTLREVKELLALKVNPQQPCTEAVRQIEAKAAEVRAKIAHLQAIQRTLNRMKASCQGHCLVSECPILESLDAAGPC
jgi:DNA-binding transcriptional MerR regulator